MNAKLKAVLIHYAGFFALAVLSAYTALHKTPFELSSADVKSIVSAGITALVGVAVLALNPKFGGYGLGS